MASYRKIDKRTWSDAKFRSLSKPDPNAQSLWFFLLTGPHTLPIPGLFSIGVAAISESMNWPVADTQKCFAELVDAGMVRADMEARLVWIPNAIRYNQPENPNVILGWRSHWDELPECGLKREAGNALRQMIPQGEGFLKAFGEVFQEGFAKSGTGTGTGTGTKDPPSPQRGESEAKAKKKTQVADGFDEFWTAYPRKVAKPKAVEAWNRLQPDRQLRERMLAALASQASSAEWVRDEGRYIPHPSTYLNQQRWEDQLTTGQPKPSTPRAATDEEMAHATYNPTTGMILNSKTCRRHNCQRPECIAAREEAP